MSQERNEQLSSTQYPRTNLTPRPANVVPERRGHDGDRRRRSETTEEVDAFQSNRNRSPGSTLPGDLAEPRATTGRIVTSLRQTFGRRRHRNEGTPGPHDMRSSKLEGHPVDGNAEDVALHSVPGEDLTRIRPSSPIARVHKADENIVCCFEDLYAGLRTWSAPFATEHKMDNFDSNQMQVIEKVMPDPRNGEHVALLAANGRSERHLVEAIVSHVIFSCIIPSNDYKYRSSLTLIDAWMSVEVAESVDVIETALKESDQERISPRELNEWRALTIALLSRTRPDTSRMESVNEKAGSLAADIMECLKSWRLVEESRAGLLNLIKDSIELFRLLRQQRALWSVKYRIETAHDPLNRFDAETMTDVDAEDDKEDCLPAGNEQAGRESTASKEVLFMIFPGLFKRGDADGLRYGIEECRIKMRVKVVRKYGEKLCY